ncbi:hypothetical protein HF324_31940 [Chitinophaga oryzae]|uniref:Na+-translocating membrane potential-generating system MpsC domain-containing protein n=1 Tax=Chitinophaga oryzae TaxID=2725414 RepID=A0ABX6LQR2_9BACT|nr:hypothetical protein [Chitinophaga oryzae]QJB42204.1 hypothetical protein HF324_31940 [Chitinophaga oryzae]
MTDKERLNKVRKLLTSKYKEIETKFFDANSKVEYHYFELERENFLSVFKRRQKSSNLNVQLAQALNEVIVSFESTNDERILSNTILRDKRDLMIYTNVDMTVLFGVLVFNNE